MTDIHGRFDGQYMLLIELKPGGDYSFQCWHSDDLAAVKRQRTLVLRHAALTQRRIDRYLPHNDEYELPDGDIVMLADVAKVSIWKRQQ